MSGGRRLLITGGCGFIGANFVHYWMRSHPGDYLVVLDALSYAGNPANLAAVQPQPNFRFVHGDIRDRLLVDTLLQEHTIDTIVHFAAESHVDRSIMGPDAFIQTNILGTFTLLEAARTAWLEGSVASSATERYRFHHISTDEVYGSLGHEDPAFTETTRYAPNSPYAASKAASDHLVRAYHHTYGLPATISNCSNNYGPYQFPEKLIPLTLLHALEGKPLPLYGDGRNVRDWLYVEDHCRGIELVLEQGRVGEIYNIGGNNECANVDTVKLICRILDEAFARHPPLKVRFPQAPAARGEATEHLIAFVKDRPGHDRRYAIDASKVMVELGYQPQESFETGLRKTIQWYLANEPWWRGITDGSYHEWIEKQYGAAWRPERGERL
jgi:dTDP-glucose 4,6-dehydratase